MSGFIEIVVALILLGVIASFIAYVMGFFSFIPASIMTIFVFGLALDIVLFIIHRK